MELEKARELISVQVGLSSGYNRNSVRLILAEVLKSHNQEVVDQLIHEFSLETQFGIKPGEPLYL